MKVLNQASGKDWTVFNADACEAIAGIPSNSIDLSVDSPPFENLYTYSASPRDMGNTEDSEHFFSHFQFLIKEWLRVTVPGRLAVIHCKDLPLYAGRDGTTGLRDFPGEIIKHFEGDTNKLRDQLEGLKIAHSILLANHANTSLIESEIAVFEQRLLDTAKANWVYHSRITIEKDPVIERARTNNNGLLYKTVCRDSSQCRQGMADYLLVFRKWSDDMESLMSQKPVTRDGERFIQYPYIGCNPPARSLTDKMDPSELRYYSIDVWQRYANPVWVTAWNGDKSVPIAHRYAPSTWWDNLEVKQTNVLNTALAKEHPEERHICPLQLDLIERCIELWSNPGDVVFDPFSGLGSVGYQAVKQGRRYIGTELKKSYFENSVKFLTKAENAQQLQLVFS